MEVYVYMMWTSDCHSWGKQPSSRSQSSSAWHTEGLGGAQAWSAVCADLYWLHIDLKDKYSLMASFPHAIFNICQMKINEFKLDMLASTVWQTKKKSQK